MLKVIIAMGMMVLASAATAQLHRCTGPDGKTTYTDRACETGERKAGVKIVDNSVDGSELRDAAARGRAELRATRNRAESGTDSASPDEDRSSSAACKSARRNYEVETSIKTTPDPAKMEQRRQAAEDACAVRQRVNVEHAEEIAKREAAARRRAAAEEAARAAERHGDVADANGALPDGRTARAAV